MALSNDQQLLVKQEVITMLTQHGITPTQQRLVIGRLLFSKPQHVSAEQVLELVTRQGESRVSKATVYNTLNLFARHGMVREVIVDPSKVFYDSNVSEHHHVFNVDTGMLSDMAADELTLTGIPSLPDGTAMVRVDVILRVRNGDGPTL